ncbi:hypothetical protein J6590_071136 [Homalodisca vitripennis]|nr:hypothetical protein J6590_071136 [Homalodisca vitripennis]
MPIASPAVRTYLAYFLSKNNSALTRVHSPLRNVRRPEMPARTPQAGEQTSREVVPKADRSMFAYFVCRPWFVAAAFHLEDWKTFTPLGICETVENRSRLG